MSCEAAKGEMERRAKIAQRSEWAREEMVDAMVDMYFACLLFVVDVKK